MKLGLSSCSKPFSEELFQNYAAAGIAAMEISYHRAETDALDFAQAKRWAQAHGVELWSLHLPFAPFNIIDPSRPSLADKTVDYFIEVMRRANGEAGITRFIVHPSAEPIPDSDRALRMETSQRSLDRLATFADTIGAVICVENLPRTCLGNSSDEMLTLLTANDSLRVCFDTNHLLGEDFAPFIEKLGDKIVTTHVSDYDFEDECHWLPGEGRLDWQRLYQTLLASGYDGVWLYELGFAPPDDLPERTKDLTCADFAENAKKIFNGTL
ncbi:MAG: sugar phosphate isomerase/epimerase [Clostridia bacterium]|nr:sugar phosphate isomerase/epimerase [Clostridia bacterium]